MFEVTAIKVGRSLEGQQTIFYAVLILDFATKQPKCVIIVESKTMYANNPALFLVVR